MNLNPDEQHHIDHMTEQMREIEQAVPTPEPFICHIAGIPHRKPDLTLLKVGDPVQLISEPDNKFDPNAIKVLHNGIHLGYIPKLFTYKITPSTSMKIVSIQPSTKWREVTISE